MFWGPMGNSFGGQGLGFGKRTSVPGECRPLEGSFDGRRDILKECLSDRQG